MAGKIISGPHVPVLTTWVETSIIASIRRFSESGSIPNPFIIADVTAGAGGHSNAIAAVLHEHLPFGINGAVLATDRDPVALAASRQNTSTAPVPVHVEEGTFRDLPDVVRRLYDREMRISGLLADLGTSKMQLDDQARGFSFSARNAALDMRMGSESSGSTAGDILNNASYHELARIFNEYGGERYAGRVARAVVERREDGLFETVGDLVSLVESCVPREKRRHKGVAIHPATRVMQGLRIAVNDELRQLDDLLTDVAPSMLHHGGLAMFMSYHSDEDRRVKKAFNNDQIWTRVKPWLVRPSDQEIHSNPRSRSAKARAAELVVRSS